MIGVILLFGVLAGLDNLQVCSSLGLLPIRRRRMHLLAALFSLCEIAAPLLGLVIGHAMFSRFGQSTQLAGPLMTLGCGATVLFCALRHDDTGAAGSPWLLGLPLSLSLDNLVAGVGLSTISCPFWIAALSIGAVSAGMSCVGLYAAASLREALRRVLPVPVEGIVGAYLCLLAVRMLLVDAA